MYRFGQFMGPTTTQVAGGITTVFKDARSQIQGDTTRIVNRLISKKAEMFAEITRLEREFVDKYQHKQTELIKLKALQKQAGELSENALSAIQRIIATELEYGMETISYEIEESKDPGYQIDIKWRISLTSLLSQINSSTILVNKVPQRDNIISPKTELSQPAYSLRRGSTDRQPTGLKKMKYSASKT